MYAIRWNSAIFPTARDDNYLSTAAALVSAEGADAPRLLWGGSRTQAAKFRSIGEVLSVLANLCPDLAPNFPTGAGDADGRGRVEIVKIVKLVARPVVPQPVEYDLVAVLA